MWAIAALHHLPAGPQREVVLGLAALLQDTEGRVRDAAQQALKALTGKDFGKSPESWQQWVETQP